jgi:hypothetical protein
MINTWRFAGLDTLQSAAVATGNGTAVNLKGFHELVLQISGITTATITFEGTVNDSAWFAVGMAAVGTGVVATTATADGAFYLPRNLHLSQFRARISAWTSGTITVVARRQE